MTESSSSLTVREVDAVVVQLLKARAARHGRTVEAEHRALLAEALLKPQRRSLAKALAAMPDVGLDTDFERVQADQGNSVFD